MNLYTLIRCISSANCAVRAYNADGEELFTIFDDNGHYIGYPSDFAHKKVECNVNENEFTIFILD